MSHTGSCVAAGFDDCCTGFFCFGAPVFDCYCDTFCTFFGDCCFDFYDICDGKSQHELVPIIQH